MNTIEQMYEDGLLSNDAKVLLMDLAKGDENILVIGNDKQMNGLLLMAILRERSGSELGWYFKDRDDLNLRSLAPNLTVINSNQVKSYAEARELVRAMTFTPIVIDEINTPAMAKFFLECCVGLRDRVTAAYTEYGDPKAVLNSFARLTREGVDHRTEEMVVNSVRDTVNVFIIYAEENGQKKIYVIDNRRQ
ncbi:hypothetical protein BK138_34085 [Paenibacillus rhizosphaerae]|uniref:Uncharacterized protein n=1 Tax=Paenibacillus rhizosphaerae TaxID=297318 RepID=A0A1R1DZL6_9BACL|nr:hypothetical protein [Paenibacillus rhizosphaerae]OMF45001.1 hypothetical protein BK138_34085 [Paenibacillus rhizosphaerae]